MSEPYSRELIQINWTDCSGGRINNQKRRLRGNDRPNLETAAEYRFLRTIGADVVGMSTIPEDIVAIHSGMKVLDFRSLQMPVSGGIETRQYSEIIRTAKEAEPKLTLLIKKSCWKVTKIVADIGY